MSDVVEVPTKSDEERARHDVAERLSARQQLARGERGERRGVEQVEFQADGVGQLERALGVARHVVPDARVRHVDRAEEVRRGGAAPPQRPQERVEPTLVLYSAQRTRPLSLSAYYYYYNSRKYTDTAKFAGHLPHRYGNSRAIWDHTVLPATRQR